MFKFVKRIREGGPSLWCLDLVGGHGGLGEEGESTLKHGRIGLINSSMIDYEDMS